MGLLLYNTASRSLEEFIPVNPEKVLMYNCGPTVYNYQHIGNMRSYVFADILRRAIELNGYTVKQIINITDVGHLVGDGDVGEDKIMVGARREKKSAEEIITHYSDAFFEDINSLNVEKAALYPRATAYIKEQKQMIETLHSKGFTYTTKDGIYFDTSKFPMYADFAQLDVAGLSAGARVDVGEKRGPTDFALWKFSPDDGAHREQEWISPIESSKMGFPGWHIECSAIIRAELGETIDIHTGGVDHIPVHHTNEIAQSESVTGTHPLARMWMHNAHILINGEKMSKSLGNVYLLNDLHERGIPPLAYRYYLLMANYRTQVNVTWEALAAAQSAYNRLTNFVLSLTDIQNGSIIDSYFEEFTNEINNDLNTANSIALIWKLTKDTAQSDSDKYATIVAIDDVLGLGLSSVRFATKQIAVPDEVARLVEARKKSRDEKNFPLSDSLREKIKALGYEVVDSPTGQKIEKK